MLDSADSVDDEEEPFHVNLHFFISDVPGKIVMWGRAVTKNKTGFDIDTLGFDEQDLG